MEAQPDPASVTRVGNVTVHLGDSRLVLASDPPEHFDCIISDPPYGETSLAWDSHVDGWLDACRRVLKPSGSLWCFGSLRFFMERAGDFKGWNLAQDIVWEKHNGSGFAAVRFKRVHELAVQFYPLGSYASLDLSNHLRRLGDCAPEHTDGLCRCLYDFASLLGTSGV